MAKITQAEIKKNSKNIPAKKRVLALSGGGPGSGLEIGAMRAFEEAGINFDVVTSDCIGSWVAAIYYGVPQNQLDQLQLKRWQWVAKCFEGFFVPDDIYKSFPIMQGFIIDYFKTTQKTIEKMLNPDTYSKLFLPERIMEYFLSMTSSNPFQDKDVLNGFITKGLSLNPLVRFMIELSYKVEKTGITSQITQPAAIEMTVKKMINFDTLINSPTTIYLNAFNLTRQEICLFINRLNHPQYKPITPFSLGAASTILYYIETQTIDNEQYCEGAVVDTVNFKDLLTNHPDVDEIWVIKIDDYKTIKPPKNLFEAALLQVMAPFDTIADDDIKLFRYHLNEYNKEHSTNIKLIEVPMKYEALTYDWNYTNLYKGLEIGYEATKKRLDSY